MNEKSEPPPPEAGGFALEASFQDNTPGRRYFLDLESGKILLEQDPDGASDDSAGQRVRIEPAPPKAQYQWMESFVASVADRALYQQLVQAMDGRRAFRRFKDLLLLHPLEYARWRAHRTRSLRAYIREWLERKRIAPESLPQWGAAVASEPPPERASDPAEALRLHAHTLIGRLPARELPAAIAYLRFLGERA